jgi:thermitase
MFRGVCLLMSFLLAVSCVLLFAPSPAYAQAPHQPDEILVKLRPGVRGAEARQLGTRHGVVVIEAIEQLGLYRMRIPGGRSVPEMVELFASDPSSEYAEPNHRGRGGDFVPNDTWFSWQWHLDNNETGADIDAVEGWQISRGSASIVVAVLDTGIDSDHPEFLGRILPGFDFVNEDADPEADHPHGSEVTGLLAANADNAFGVAGVDHAAGILPVKVLDAQNGGTTFDLAQGLTFAADSGADVISMSLIDYWLGSTTLNDALQYARDAGAVLVACAGNGGIGNADESSPGASPLTISVGATDFWDQRASYSGTGSALDVVAPAQATATVSHGSSGDSLGLFGGCSAATPIAAGIASLVLAVDGSLGHDDVLDILTQSADDQVGPPGEDTPGRDDFFGHGRVNLNGALTLAVAGLPDCSDGIDNDGDGSSDYPDDPGCDYAGDASERSPLLDCDDGIDNDEDGRIDFDPITFFFPGDQETLPEGTGDPGCKDPSWSTESPQCQDGINNDLGQDPNPGHIDYDAGYSANGSPDPNGPDPQCIGKPWKDQERKASICGLGSELVLLLPPLMWLWRRRRS